MLAEIFEQVARRRIPVASVDLVQARLRPAYDAVAGNATLSDDLRRDLRIPPD